MGNVSNLAEAREARRLQKPHQSSGKGFALLHRKIMDVPFYKDAEASHLWVHLILKAKHAPESVLTDIGEMLVNRGQLLSGRNALAFETGLKADRVQYLLRKFQKLGMVSWVSHGKFSVFTIVKYDDYQSNSVPADYKQITSAKPDMAPYAKESVPADYQQITTDKEVINISLTNVRESASATENQDKKKSSLSCEQVVEVYHRVLPEAQGIRILTDKRRNLIRSFWKKAGAANRQLGGAGFTLADWEAYLSYIATNCRWMLENRPDNRTGRTWRRKALEYFLNVDVYVKTREGACDDL
ncbi:DNA replication protein [Salmonella enterica]|uniref:DNA replication protein n=1 Tax=Salmonella enterica subsp. enterica serovar Saintpaul TaxID=90105 RepID=A0A5W5JDC9_SALET|nr:DNA replication protein [Salmonella enterica]EBX1943163.1 DNA replication protein [Salmonella enterica subsp. enterica serovar Saintpaul]EAT8462365.1 DNA replication protein [Salmonella enterica]EAW5279935.1 DNA replication protein [Salmonella enterica]EBN2770830.1 DNA replication protein [Salmonella enterica]